MPIASALRSVLRWFGFALLALASPLVWGQAGPSAAADGFDPNVNGIVYALAVQPDGKILIAGSFTTLQPNGATSASARNNIARVLPGGQVDATFNGNVSGQISAMVLQPDGKILIGGKFTSVSGAARNRVARLNADGSVDASFDPNVGGPLTPEVTSLALQSDQKIVVGGGFTTVQPNGAAAAVTRNRIARFNADGTLDSSFDPNANGMVLSLAVQVDGKIVVGGGFTTLQPAPAGTTAAVTRNRIARLNTDGSVDTAFNPDANNSVNAIAIQIDGRILIGGTFTTLAGASANRLARLETSGAVSPSSSFVGGSDGQIYVIKPLEDGRIMVGGSFSTVGGATRAYVARLLPGGAGDTSFVPRPNFNVYAIAEQSDGSLVLGGGFTALGGTGATAVVRNHVARVFANGEVDADFRPDANGRLRSVAVQSDGKVLVGGSFTSVGGVTHSGIVRLNVNGAVDPSFNASVSGTVLSVVQQSDGKIVIGGSFSRVNGVARFNLARLEVNGSIDTSFETATNNLVNAVALQSDGKILLGGTFTVVRSTAAGTSVSRNNVARINSSGALDDAYKVRTNDAVQTIAVQSDGKALFGGAFTVVSGDETSSVQRGGIFRANVDGTIDTSFNVNVEGSVSAILVQTGGDIVFGGSFTRVSAGTVAARYNIARVNGTGVLDTVFDPSTNGAVLSLAQQNDGKILVGGFFSVLRPNGAPESGAVARRYLARVNVDGTADAYDLQLDENPGNVVTSLVKNSSGEILIGGSFTSLGSLRRNRIARISATGVIDESFNADLNTATGPTVQSLASDGDGRVLAAGSFSSISGSQSVNLTRFNRDGFPDTTFTPTINGPVYATAQLPTKGAPVATQRPGLAWLQSNGQLRAGTIAAQPTLTTVNKVLVQPNGKILLGGSNGTSNSLVRFNSDGSADTEFAPAVIGIVYEIKMGADDKILIGGAFTGVRGEVRNNIARLNADGTLDTAFNPNANEAVFAIERQSDGKILVGGQFTSFQPNGGAAAGRNGVARLNADGTLDPDFNPNVNQAVRAILLQSDGKIVIGGMFTTVQPNSAAAAVSRPYLARLNANGTLDDAFDLKVDSSVVALARDGTDRLLVGGYFSNIGGVARNYLARINANGTIDAAFNPNPNEGVQTISIQSDGNILIGGAFSALDPGNTVSNPATATPRNRSARLNENGSLDPSFNPNFNNLVSSIVVGPGDTILAAGAFTAIQPSGSLLVGGTFGMINGLVVNNLALFGLDGSISSAFQPNPNGTVYALLPQINQQVIVAGAFTEIAGTTRHRLARFKADDTLDTAFNPAPDGDVFALAIQADGKLFVGGAFTSIGGAGRPYLARLNLDGSNDATFSPSVTGAVRSIAVQADGRVLITYDTTGGNQLVRLVANGSLDSTFNAANNGMVSAIAVQADGGVVVGGSFTSIGGGARSYLARLTANGTLDPSLTAAPNGAVTALTLQDDGKIVIGGTFYAVDGLPRFGIARIAAPAVAMDTFTSDSSRSTVTWTRSGGAPEIQGAVFEASNDGATWTLLGEATRVNTTSNWKVSGLNLSSSVTFFVRARAIVPGTPGSSTGVVASQSQFNFSAVTAVPAIPVITSATAVNAAAGTPFAYAIAASGIPTNFGATGLPAGLSINTATGLISGTPTQEGTFSVTLSAMNALGSGSTTLNLFVGAPGSIVDNGRVVNLSVLAPVTAANPIIAGFVIKGAGTQSVLIRAVGPGLTTVGVNNGLATPTLKVFNSGGQVIHESTSWGGSSTLSAEFARLGAFPLAPTSADAAVILTLNSGAYTLHVLDPGSTGGSALAEVYDALPTPPPSGSPHLINISARGVVATAGQQVTSGFVIVGSSPKQMLIRGIGPGLTGQGVTGALSNPVVTLNKIGSGAGVIAQNDNWETPLTVDAAFPAATGAQISAAATATGAFAIAAGSTDSAILLTLAPGVYTAQVGGSGSATGAAMVEIYELP